VTSHLFMNIFLSYVRHDWRIEHCIQSNRLASAFHFGMRYTKGEEKVCVLDRKTLVSEDVCIHVYIWQGLLVKSPLLLITLMKQY